MKKILYRKINKCIKYLQKKHNILQPNLPYLDRQSVKKSYTALWYLESTVKSDVTSVIY